MKKFLTLALAGALVLGAGSVAYANICAFDPAPAATVLFPFVVYNYDLGDDGYNTLMAITNVSSEAQIIHVTVWTDYSQAILDFNIVLTGYDMISFNTRDILKNGKIPRTVTTDNDDGDDPDYIRNGAAFGTGPWSNDNVLTALTGDPQLPDPDPTDDLACDSGDDAYPGAFGDPDGDISGDVLDFFEDWLTVSQQGENYFNDECDPADYDDEDDYQNVSNAWWVERDTSHDTWMYITVDVVNWCNKSFPDAPGYFDSPLFDPDEPRDGGEALPWNVLIGDVQFVSNADRLSEVENAVHIEADSDIGDVVGENDFGDPYTFYSRYSNLDGEVDYREPLPTAWALRYQMASLQAGDLKTYVRAFKTTAPWFDSSIDDYRGDTTPDLVQGGILAPPLTAINCLAYTLYIWDEDEDVVEAGETDPFSRPGTGPGVQFNKLPLETQEVDASQFQTKFDAGWYLFVWPASNGAPGDGRYEYQTWMGVKYVLEGQYSGARSGAVMANYNCFDQQELPDLGVNFKYIWGMYSRYPGYTTTSE